MEEVKKRFRLDGEFTLKDLRNWIEEEEEEEREKQKEEKKR